MVKRRGDKLVIGLIILILLAGFIYALNVPSFVDTSDTGFAGGTLHLTNITGSGVDANVTLNFTLATSNASSGQRIYNISGNFTSQTFDTNSTESVFDRIAWTRVLANSSDVAGYALLRGDSQPKVDDLGVFYRNGSISADFQQKDFESDIGFEALTAYTLPTGLKGEDIIGFAIDDDGSNNLYAFFRNGTVANSSTLTDLTSDITFPDTSTFTLPIDFNTSDIIGFIVNSGDTDTEAAVFFKNKSYIVASREQPPFTFTTVRAFTLLSDFDTADVIGVALQEGKNDISLFFRNGSFVSDLTQLNFNTNIDFDDGVFTATYPSGFDLVKHTNITLQTRISNDSTTFTPWSANYSNSNGSEVIADNVGRYIQYKAVLETPDKYITPHLLNVTINFTGDVTAPTINKISFSPNSTDNVDPNVLLNFTVNVTDNPDQIEVRNCYHNITLSC